MPSAYVGWIEVDLNDLRSVWIELRPSEVRSEKKQHVTVEDSAVTGAAANDPGHADIVRIVIFEEVLAAGCVGHRCFQACRRGNHLVMRARATSTGIDRDRVALV